MWFVLGLDSDAGELGTAVTEERELLTSRTKEGKAYQAECAIWRLGADCIKEGKWKILHLHQYDMIRFPAAATGFVFAEERFATDGIRLDAMFRSIFCLQKTGPGKSGQCTDFLSLAVPRGRKTEK